MVRIQVRAVRSAADQQAWVELPRRTIYPRSSPWVPPLDSDLRRLLDRRKNPFFRHGAALPLLAIDDRGAPIGRVLAHIYHRHNVRLGERAAFFGFFECPDDRDVARALVSAAAAFGTQHGCTVLRGPFNMTAMQEMGVLLDGFESPPVVDETYTAPYYPALLEAAGLRPAFPVSTFRVDDLDRVEPDALLAARHQTLLAEGRLRIRAANPRLWDRELETLREILNDSFHDNPLFVPITADEFVFQVGPYRRLMDPAISLVAELDGVPCGFALTVPDFNPLLKRMNGRLGPGSLLAFLRGRSQIRDAVLIIMGVQRHLQGQGIMRVLQAELIRALRRRNYRRLTVTWIADGNHLSRATVTAIGARPFHRLTLYESPLPLSEVTVGDGAHLQQPWGE